MTMLGMPAVPAPSLSRQAGAVAFTAGHHFTVTDGASIEELAETATVPLSVILQVTKRCNFDCSFCSETLQLPDPTLTELDTIRANLAGVGRVFLSGGEPLMRRDFGEIVDMYTGDFILGIPTNAT
jgi:MoaA/NifB/PqqE/SkfB family radical SAM enzyme